MAGPVRGRRPQRRRPTLNFLNFIQMKTLSLRLPLTLPSLRLRKLPLARYWRALVSVLPGAADSIARGRPSTGEPSPGDDRLAPVWLGTQVHPCAVVISRRRSAREYYDQCD